MFTSLFSLVGIFLGAIIFSFGVFVGVDYLRVYKERSTSDRVGAFFMSLFITLFGVLVLLGCARLFFRA